MGLLPESSFPSGQDLVTSEVAQQKSERRRRQTREQLARLKANDQVPPPDGIAATSRAMHRRSRTAERTVHLGTLEDVAEKARSRLCWKPPLAGPRDLPLFPTGQGGLETRLSSEFPGRRTVSALMCMPSSTSRRCMCLTQRCSCWIPTLGKTTLVASSEWSVRVCLCGYSTHRLQEVDPVT